MGEKPLTVTLDCYEAERIARNAVRAGDWHLLDKIEAAFKKAGRKQPDYLTLDNEIRQLRRQIRETGGSE